MVRRGVASGATAVGLVALLTAFAACERDRDMAPSADMPDTSVLRDALREPAARDALMDTMPGGEMARGDSLAESELLEEKMP